MRNIQINTTAPATNTVNSNTTFNPFVKQTNQVWGKDIVDIDVSPDPESCLTSLTPTQSFSARLSKQAPETSYQGTFLHLSGSPTTEYVFNIQNPRYDSRRLLEFELWKKGFRILEFKFSSNTGWDPQDLPDEQWRENGVTCFMQPFVKALQILTENGMWPKNQNQKYGMGTNNGALLWSYAINYFKDDNAKVNKVILQSPIYYDIYNQCKEQSTAPFTDFYIKEQCQNPDQHKSFFEDQSIKYTLDETNCAMTLGKDSHLMIFGQDGEVPAWYKDESQRFAPTREQACPTESATWDSTGTGYEGHAPIVSYFTKHKNVNPFVDYIVKGVVNFD